MPNRPIHILRYGTVAERVHLEKAISAYDYLAINGNSAAYVSTAISKFIVEKFFSKPEKGFFIDPITYAFQNEIRLLKSKSKATGEEKIKKSIDKLIDEYGYPVTKVRQNIPVSTEDFSDIEVVTAFCKKVLGFQYDLVDKYIKGEELEKYFMYMTPDLSKQNLQLRPKFLIAPYFYLDAQDKKFDDWLDINIKMARLSCKLAAKSFSNADVFVQIAINKNVLYNPNQMYALTQAYKGVDCSGYTIWIDDFNEHEASLFELKRFTEMLKFLSPKPVYNMYGGFFSILLTHKEISLLKGVSHGLEYGESRKAYPVGGGIPVSKYYYLEQSLYELCNEYNSGLTKNQQRIFPDLCFYNYDLSNRKDHMPSTHIKAKGHKNIKVLKMHGSLSWLECPKCRRIYTDFSREIALDELKQVKCPKCKSDGFEGEDPKLRSLIITPTFMKSLDNLNIKNIWQNAFIDISESDHLIFIGYSFPDADFEMRCLLKKAVKSTADVTVVLDESNNPQKYINNLMSKGFLIEETNQLVNRLWLPASRYKSFFGEDRVKFIYDGFEKYIELMGEEFDEKKRN